MAAYGCTRRLLPALVLSLLVLGPAVEAFAYSGYKGYGGDDIDRMKEKHQERVTKEAEKYVKALKDVMEDEERVQTLLQQDEQKARTDAAGDDVKLKRTVRLVRHKGIKTFLKIDAKYGQLFAGIQKFRKDEGDYFTPEAKGKIDILEVQVKDQARSNRQRIADLYVDVDEPIKALKVLEGIYKSMSAQERLSAMDLRARIKGLKAQLGIKDDADGQ